MTELNKTGDNIPKGWGFESILESNDQYCVKTLNFTVEDAKSSMHFHQHKKETWVVLSGEFDLHVVDTTTTEVSEIKLLANSVVTINAMTPHQLFCVSPGCILEMSTPDVKGDNFRLSPGDSQKVTNAAV